MAWFVSTFLLIHVMTCAILCNTVMYICKQANLTPSFLLAFLGLSNFSNGDISLDDDHTLAHYNHLQDSIATLQDKVLKTHILHRPNVPLP